MYGTAGFIYSLIYIDDLTYPKHFIETLKERSALNHVFQLGTSANNKYNIY